MVCAGDLKTNTGFCQGDEGGALTCDGYLHGISSWGFGCGDNYPSVYTKVYHFKDWINGQIKLRA